MAAGPPPRNRPHIETTVSARRKFQRNSRRETFSESRIRQLEREQAQLTKAAEAAERERKRKANKLKQEGKEKREKEAKKKLVEEGRISEEDTWGKIRASQRRLNAFFVGPVAGGKRKREDFDMGGEEQRLAVCKKRGGQGEGEAKMRSGAGEVMEPVLGDNAQIRSLASDMVSHISSELPSSLSATRAATHSKSVLPEQNPNPIEPEPAMALPKVADTVDDEQYEDDTKKHGDQLDSSLPSSLDFVIWEDEDCKADSNKDTNTSFGDADTAINSQLAADPIAFVSSKVDADVTTPRKPSTEASGSDIDLKNVNTPTKPSVRSILGQMTPSQINTREQQKPDITSAPLSSSSLPSPSPEKIRDLATSVVTPQDAAQVLAMICSQDLADDSLDGHVGNKENSDPLHFTPTKTPAAKKDSVTGSPKKGKNLNNAPTAAALDDEEEAETDYEDVFDKFDKDSEDYDSLVDVPEAVWQAATGTPSKTNLKQQGSTIKHRNASVEINSTPIKLKLSVKGSPSPIKVFDPIKVARKDAEGNGKGKGKAREEHDSSSFGFGDVSEVDLEMVARQYDALHERKAAGMGISVTPRGFEGVEEWD